MPRNPSTGVFTRVSNSFSDPVVGTVIDQDDGTALFQDYDAGLTNTVAIGASQTILPGDQAQILTNLGGTTVGKSLFAATDEAVARTTLGATAIGSDLFTAANAGAARTTISAQAALGYAPVQQGTGVGQDPNVVKIGWGIAVMSLLATVDSVDLGRIWTDYIASQSFTANGYVKLPNGLIIQWGTSTNGSAADYNQSFPIVFPTACVVVVAQVAYSALSSTSAYVLSADSYDSASPTLFSIRKRRVDNGGTVSAVTDGINVRYIAIGL